MMSALSGDTLVILHHLVQSRGVAILFNNNFELKVQKVYKDVVGNFMFISLTTMDMLLMFTVLTVLRF